MKKWFQHSANQLCNLAPLSSLAGPEGSRSGILIGLVGISAALAMFDAVLVVLLFLAPSFLTIRLVYDFNTLILPSVLVVMAAIGFAVWNRRPYERGVLRLSVLFTAALLALIALRIYATHIEPYRLQVKHVTIQTPKVKHPLRILHISDIQSAQVGEYEEQVFAEMRRLAPDLVLFTGDLLQPIAPASLGSELPRMTSLLSSLTPSNGIFGVGGDVDYGLPRDPASMGGLLWLYDNSIHLATDAGPVNILGLTSETARHPFSGHMIREWISATPSNELTIVIAHPPDFVLEIPDTSVDLCLAGHTHGGQIRLPLMGPLLTLSRVPHALSSGFHEVNRTRLNVSAGIGCEHTAGLPSLRILCPPEMTLIELVPESPARSSRVLTTDYGKGRT